MTLSHIYQPSHLIDTAPLALRYEFMTQAILAYIAAGHIGLVLRYSQKLLRLIRVYNRLTGANILVRRKRDMLRNSAWRRRVLWGLGGREKLRRWDAMNARFMPRLETKSAEFLYGLCDDHPAWLNTPERIAESERLKARVRENRRAALHPSIVRDRVKTDFDGLFRLPPLPRQARRPAALKIYTQHTIGEYDWNPIPFAKETGFSTAMVWPAEFYAAMIADGEMTEAEVETPSSVIPQLRFSQSEQPLGFGPIPTEQHLPLDSGSCLCKQRPGRDYNIKIPLRLAMAEKTYRAIFEDPI